VYLGELNYKEFTVQAGKTGQRRW